MNLLDAIYTVLSEASGPLNCGDMVSRIVAQKLWSTRSKNPKAAVATRLSDELRQKGGSSRFYRAGRGLYTVKPSPSGAPKSKRRARSKQSNMSFLDAAEHVLRESGSTTPMHYQDITTRAIEEELIHTASKTPENTLYVAVIMDMRRREAQGEAPRFIRPKPGMFALAKVPDDVRNLIEKRNSDVRGELLSRAKAGSPREFEQLIQELLSNIGFADVEGTPPTRDGGIDVRGTLVVGDVVSVRMAVQAKRWDNKVGPPIVQQVRGSLGAHEQGLIITTSDFTKGARDEAQRPDAAPVALMNGERLASLLAEYEMGAKREPQMLFTLREPDDAANAASKTT